MGILVVTAEDNTEAESKQEVLVEGGGDVVLNRVCRKVPKCPVECLSLANKEIRDQSTGLSQRRIIPSRRRQQQCKDPGAKRPSIFCRNREETSMTEAVDFKR